MSDLPWRKSSHSDPNGQCVEVVAGDGDEVLVRDSKRGDASPVLRLTRSQFVGLVDTIKADQLDDLT